MDVAATSKLPNPLCLSGNIYQNWLKFKGEFDDYLISIEFDEKSDKVKTAKLRNLIGDEGRQVIANLALNKSFEYDDLIAKLDIWAESHKNIAKRRSQLFCCELSKKVKENGSCLPSDDISGSIPSVPQERNLNGNDANFARRIDDNTATIRMTLEKFSKRGGVRLSPPFYFHNLFWRIDARWNQTTATEDPQLACYLTCDGGPMNHSWKCTVISIHKVLSQREGIEHSSRTCTKHKLYCPNSSSWGYSELIKKNTLLNPDNGFIKDDKIILEVIFRVID